MSVRLMLPGEVSLVTCPPDYAYDKFERLGGGNLGLVLLPFLGAPQGNLFIINTSFLMRTFQ